MAHQAVDEAADLVGIPHELPLYRRQQVLLAMDPLQDLTDRHGRLEAQGWSPKGCVFR
jgi:hypothetical protein